MGPKAYLPDNAIVQRIQLCCQALRIQRRYAAGFSRGECAHDA